MAASENITSGFPPTPSGFPFDWEKYSDLYEEITVPARTVLLREGDISRQAYYIKKGCLRLSFNDNGKDITFQFFFEGYGVSSFESFRNGRASLFGIESLEPSTLFVISKNNLDRLIAEVPGYKAFMEEALYQRLEHYTRLFLSRIRDTPRKRYEDLCKEHPEVIQRIPQHFIASYLGIIDKVIFPGVAYDYDDTGRFPRMIKRFHQLKGITLITTMNTPSFFYRLFFGNAIKKALFAGTFWKMGYRNRKWINLSMVKFVSPEKRTRWLTKLEKRFSHCA